MAGPELERMATCKDITEHVIRYSCGKCGTTLKEAESPITNIAGIYEECPVCGNRISESLQIKSDAKRNNQPSIKLLTAYELAAKLTFGIPEFDRLFTLSIGDRLCISGSRRQANLIITRLWIRALMPRRHGGLAAGKVVCIDAGNCTNLYQCVSFARQYGMEVRSILKSIVVSRVFTIYQLAGLVIRRLQEIIQGFGAKLVVISDLLKMFTDEPQVRYREARYLIQEIMRAIDRLPRDVLVIVSLYDYQNKYDKLVFPGFSKRLEIEEQLKVRLFNNQDMFSEFSMAGTDLRLVSR
jgi:hypothetical protein